MAEFEDLAREEGAVVYSELLYLLSHKRFEEEEAKRHWHEVIRHRTELRRHSAPE